MFWTIVQGKACLCLSWDEVSRCKEKPLSRFTEWMNLWHCASHVSITQCFDGESHSAALSLIIPYAKVTILFPFHW